MVEKHKPGPFYLSTAGIRTGDQPLSSNASAIFSSARSSLNWTKARQIFSYIGQGPFEPGLVPDDSPYRHLNPDVDYAGVSPPYFAVITKSEDLDNYHAIGGILDAWRYSDGATVSWMYDGSVTWEQLFRTYHDSHKDPSLVTFMNGFPSVRIELLATPGKGPRDYGGGYSFHKLRYDKMMVGNLSLWTVPDTASEMDDEDWTLFSESEFKTGRQVRSFDSSRRGIGNLIDSANDIEYRTSRCLLQSGHPLGISTGSSEYVDIRTGRATLSGNASKFRVSPRGLYSGDTVVCTPAVVAWAPGASEVSPARVRFYSVVSGDFAEIEITSGTEALYTAPGGLNVSKYDDRIIIDFKSQPGQAVAVRTYALFEDLPGIPS